MHIRIKKGLDIPIEGAATGAVESLATPKRLALDLSRFSGTRFKLLVKVGDPVKIGQPLALDKSSEKRAFVSPAGGTITEVRRGLKRRLLSIVIDRDNEEESLDHGTTKVASASRKELVDKLCQGGLFAHIRQRPFDLLAHPEQTPRDIFVSAIESAPFAPTAEMQVEGRELAFQVGLDALSRLTTGHVHLVHKAGSHCSAFTDAQGVVVHTAEGPHPVGCASLHIHEIAPITSHTEVVWTLGALDVIAIGAFLQSGHYPTERVVAIAGTGILPERRGFFRTRAGAPVEQLIEDRNEKGEIRFISGDPLMGEKVEIEGFLGFDETVFCAVHENSKREPFHFFRLGLSKYTASHAYLSGFTKKKEFDFTTSQHGEERAFVDSRPYQKVMPMQIPVVQLVKATLSGDYELAERLGILEVAAEDFALPTFICPSKIEMVEIIQKALEEYAAELIH